MAVALAGWARHVPGIEPRLSRQAAGQLDRSAGQLDRLHGPGTAAAFLLDRLEDLADQTAAGGTAAGFDGFSQVHTLAYLVAELKVRAREARRYDRHRRGLRDTPWPRPWKSRRGEVE